MNWESNPKLIFGVFAVVFFTLGFGMSLGYWSVITPTIGQVVNLALSLALLVFATWNVIKTKDEFNILRWRFALWCASAAVSFGVAISAKHPENVAFGWLLASPLLLVALYSFVQSRKPEGGRQLDFPVDLVHQYKRLGWKWITPPRWDFWPCWIGLLLPAALGLSLLVANWNYPSNLWLALLKSAGVGYFCWFAFRWVKAPSTKLKFKQLVVATVGLRSVGIIYFFSLGVTLDNPMAKGGCLRAAGSCVIAIMWTGFFENAFSRCCERSLPAGVSEYEAVEGPSLGL